MKKTLLTMVTAMAALAGVAQDSSAPLWLRYARISPDGSQIVFAYKGDLYKVPAAGGQAVQLTTQSSYESNPVWSPDGKYIAFASDRKGNNDVWVIPSTGGAARQLTRNSAGEIPTAFTPDGKSVVYNAAIQDPAESLTFPSGVFTELYSVPVEGGRSTRMLATPAEEICYSPDGSFFLYQDRKGSEDALRKHHTSSVTRDLWRYDVKSGRHTNLTRRAGEDRSPILAADGNTVYCLSERNGGTFNVWSFPLNNPSQATQVTNFAVNPVRFLSLAGNGTMCYTYDGEIYTQRPGGSPSKVAISLWHDDGDSIMRKTYTSGARNSVVSPDGKQVAFTVRGEVFVTSVEYGTTKKITDTPEAEKDITWGSDSRTLVYASERDGKWKLYKATIARADDPNFPNATLVNEELLLEDSDHDLAQPDYSPDGKSLAYVKNNEELWVLDLKTKAKRQVTDGSYWFGTEGPFSYDWSPDGKWFALEFIGHGRDPYSDIGIVSANGGKITNITNSAYINVAPQWVLDGGAIMFMSNRYGMRSHASWGSQDDVLLAFVNEDAYDRYRLGKEDYELLKEAEKAAKDKAKKAAEADGKDKKKGKKADKPAAADDDKNDLVVELDKIADRVVRVTPNSSQLSGANISKDGNTLYYLSSFEKGYDLWKMDLRKKSTSLLNKLDGRAASIQTDKEGKNFYILGTGAMKKLSGDKVTPITYRAQVKMNTAREREYMFDNVHHQVAERFYVTDYHGCDWEAQVENYRKFLPHITNNYDYANLLSELLGELNASHTGSRFYPSNANNEATGNLGAIFDYNYAGEGLKVAEVVEYGPLDRAASRVKPGTVITAINGTPITLENDYTQLLNGLAGKKTLISCKQGGQQWDEVVIPTTQSAFNGLLYTRWTKRNEALVDSLSGGRLGYVHLRSMNDASYRSAYEKVLGKFTQRDGIVIDTRFNGGGRLHEDIQILFSGEKYLTQVVRGRESCDMPSRRWNKPTIMLQCEYNYSNAHGTPWVYKHTGMGKLVGMPVPGTMTSVNWVDMQDESLIFGIPIIGYRLADGSYLENQQLEPDIMVVNEPDQIVKGRDQQIETAVRELLRECDAKK